MIRTKIIATLGPASSDSTMLRKMFLKGLDVARLNYSHGTHLEHLQRIHLIRTLNRKLKRAVKIMQDLEGYRIRIGKLKRPLVLKKHSCVYLTQEKIIGNGKAIPFDYRGSLRQIREGTLVYIDDGRLVLEVASKEKRRLKTKVVVGGILRENKGINIPAANLDFPLLTEKDKRDVRATVLYKLDYVAQSFVRGARDLQVLKGLVKHTRPNCKLFAKIENRKALANLDEIIKEADGIIIARGDLGICVPIHKVPVIQKEIIKRCRLKNRPVVVATQMLDSMTQELIPTRAEASDVANAILDGATHLLLSGETAVGRHPDRVVEMMDKIIQHTESHQRKLKGLLE